MLTHPLFPHRQLGHAQRQRLRVLAQLGGLDEGKQDGDAGQILGHAAATATDPPGQWVRHNQTAPILRWRSGAAGLQTQNRLTNAKTGRQKEGVLTFGLLFPPRSLKKPGTGTAGVEWMMTPWQVAPQLTRERLVTLATRLVEIRCRALLMHEPEEGDGPWSLGTRVYERSIKQLWWAAGREFEWLAVLLDGLFINLQVDGVSVRFYRGDPDNPGIKVVRSGLRDLEIAQAQASETSHGEVVAKNGNPYLNGLEPPATNWFWVMAVETVGEGTPARVTVEQVSDAGDTRYRWKVSVDIAAIQEAVERKFRGGSIAESMVKPPIEVEPVVVEPKVRGEEVGDERG